ncbi:MAG: endonuclease domain-containing protein [Propionicimonas sp.]
MRIDDLLADSEVIRLSDHPRSARTIQRAAARGRLVALLPGIFVPPDRAGAVGTRIRAACAWSRQGCIHSLTAVQLHLRAPVTMPIRLRAPYRGAPVPWMWVTRGTVAAPIEDAGLRIATAAHAIVELAATDRGEAAFTALRLRLVDAAQLLAVLPEFAGARGNAMRRRVIAAAALNPWSFAEARLHAVLRRAGIDGWVANPPLRFGGRPTVPDVWFPEHWLALEFDGEAVHSNHEQFEEDRRRQNRMTLARVRVLRFTWDAVERHPDEVVATVRAMLARGTP